MKNLIDLEKWKRRLFGLQSRLALASVLSFAIALIVLSVFWFQYIERERARTLSNFTSLTKTLALATKEAVLTSNIPLIDSYVTQIEQTNEAIACTTIFNRDGKVIFRRFTGKEKTLCDLVDKSFAQNKAGKGEGGWTEELLGSSYLNAVVPITIEKQPWGWVAVSFSLEETSRERLRLFSGLGLMLLWFTLVFSSTGYYVRQTMVKPIRAISNATEEISRGNLAYRVEIYSQDELGQLAHSFNEMMRELKKSRDQLEEFAETLEQKVVEKTKDLQKAETQLVQSTKLAAIGQLAGGVAHEINNPLGGILGFSQLLIRERDQNDPLVADLRRIEESALRCKRIVENLLSFSRMSKGFRQSIDVNEALQETLFLVEHQLRLAEIEIITDYYPEKLRVMADRHQLQQVFLNMILNAKDSMSGGGSLTIGTDLVKRKAYIRFTDTGCGVGKGDLSRIFDPFFTTKEVGRGTGLGLSVSYGIVQEHEGDILVMSEVGKGTVFTVVLPAAKENGETKTGEEARE